MIANLRQQTLGKVAGGLFKENPLQMMCAFQIAQEHDVDLSPDLMDLMSRHLGQITRTFQYAKKPREIFKSRV